MNIYLIKQFFRNNAYSVMLSVLFVAGLLSLFTGKKFLEKQNDTISRSSVYQKESIDRNLKFHKDDLGLILYYQKFNLVNELPNLSGLNMGVRDINPVIKGVTIRNIEEQIRNTDFFNPNSTASGNFDFIFVVVFLFPLVIIAMLFNLQSEEVERGTWKMVSVQTQSLISFLDKKLSIRILSVLIIYILLSIIGVLWLQISVNAQSILFFTCGIFYILFWAIFCRWVISLQKSTAFNALFLIGFWVSINFIIPMTANIIIEKTIPVNSSIEAFIKQRDGYHHKWDEPKTPTMQRFYAIYPQYKHYKIVESDYLENKVFNWTWYYAMHHLGDVEAQKTSKFYTHQLKERNHLARWISYLIPNINTLTSTSYLAKSDLGNQLEFDENLRKFHESKRLEFYDAVFSNQKAETINWNKQKVKYFIQKLDISALQIIIPYIVWICLFLILSQINFKKL